MTIHYRKALKSIGWVAVCLLGIEQVAFAADDTTESKKGSYYGRAKRAANKAAEDVLSSKPVVEAGRLADEAKNRVANSKPVTEATKMANAAIDMADKTKGRVLNSKVGKSAQDAINDITNRICTFKLNQANSNAEKLEAQAGQLKSNAIQLRGISGQQKGQAEQITEECGGGILCTLSLKLASYNAEKYAGLAAKMDKLADEALANAEESRIKADELDKKCVSRD